MRPCFAGYRALPTTGTPCAIPLGAVLSFKTRYNVHLLIIRWIPWHRAKLQVGWR